MEGHLPQLVPPMISALILWRLMKILFFSSDPNFLEAHFLILKFPDIVCLSFCNQTDRQTKSCMQMKKWKSNLYQCHFVHHKSHIDRLATNRTSQAWPSLPASETIQPISSTKANRQQYESHQYIAQIQR